MAKAETEQLANYRWLVLSVSTLTFMMYAYALQSIPPLIEDVIVIFKVDAPSAGLFMSMAVIPGVVLALPAGILIGKYNYRRIGTLAVSTITIGSLTMALAQNFPVALLSRFIVGVGGGLLSVGTPTIVPQWFRHHEMGKSMAVYALGMPIATTAAFFTVPILTQDFNWQFPFYICALASMISAILFWLIMRDGPLKEKSVEFSEIWRTFSNSEIWKISLVWMFFNMIATGFLTWAPTLFITFKDLSPISAGIFSSIIMITNFFFVPFYGWASDKLGKRKPFIIAGIISMGLSLYLITYTSGLFLAISIVILGVAAGAVPPLVMALIGQNLSSKLASTGFGLVTLWQNLGIMFTAPLVGYFLQNTQSLLWTFFGMSTFGFAGGIVALTIHSK